MTFILLNYVIADQVYNTSVYSTISDRCETLDEKNYVLIENRVLHRHSELEDTFTTFLRKSGLQLTFFGG